MVLFNMWFAYILLFGELQKDMEEDHWGMIEKCWH